MKKIIFPLLLSSFLISGFNVTAQWLVGGNALAAPGTLGSTTAQPVVFFSSGTERGRLHANGNWAFGTFGGVDKVQINTSAGTNAFRAAVGGTTKLLVHSGGGVSIGSGSTPPTDGLYVATRIGIATTTPAYGLDVRGSTAFGQFKSTGGSAGLIIDKSAFGQNGYILYRTAGADRWTEGTLVNDNFALRNGSLGTNAVTIDIANNNVGIPTISPGAKLNVVASASSGAGVNASGYDYGVQANSTGSSGYGVFGTSKYLGVYGSASSGSYGIFGYSNDIGAYGSGTNYGTYGYNGAGRAGAYGVSFSGYGVQGESTTNYGGYFNSTDGYGIVASSTNAFYAAAFYGRVYSSLGFLTSDKNLKKDIREFKDAMSIINKLKPTDYLFKDDAKYASLHLPTGRHYGLLAQDLEQVLPNLVSEAPHQLIIGSKPRVPIRPTADGKPQPIAAETKETKETINIKAVNYVELIPIMVKAMQEQDIKMQEQDIKIQEQDIKIQEQDIKIEKQEAEITNLKKEINELKALIKNVNGSTPTAAAGYLKQNNPNPLNGNTVIKYFAPADARNAQILVTDMKGRILKTYKVTNGEGQLTIRTGELPSGTYNYTLYVNHSKIDTKQMIIAR